MSTATPSFAAVLPIQERRAKFRYALDLTVRFRSLAKRSVFWGAGHVINLSSGGVWVVSRHPVPQGEISAGARVEMSIEWPSLLDGRIPLQLFAVGRIIRRGASGFAATFVRHEFRRARGDEY